MPNEQPPWFSMRSVIAFFVTGTVGTFIWANWEYFLTKREWNKVLDQFYVGEIGENFTALSRFMTSDFMLGVGLASLVYGIWDVVALFRKRRVLFRQNALRNQDGINGKAIMELHVIKAVRSKSAFDAVFGMIAGFGNMAMAGRDEANQRLIRLALECESAKYEQVRSTLEAPLDRTMII